MGTVGQIEKKTQSRDVPGCDCLYVSYLVLSKSVNY